MHVGIKVSFRHFLLSLEKHRSPRRGQCDRRSQDGFLAGGVALRIRGVEVLRQARAVGLTVEIATLVVILGKDNAKTRLLLGLQTVSDVVGVALIERGVCQASFEGRGQRSVPIQREQTRENNVVERNLPVSRIATRRGGVFGNAVIADISRADVVVDLLHHRHRLGNCRVRIAYVRAGIEVKAGDIPWRIPAQGPDFVFLEIHPDVVLDELAHIGIAVTRTRTPLRPPDAGAGDLVRAMVEVRVPAVEILQIGGTRGGQISVVVVDDVDLHGNASLVRFVDEVLEAIRTAIGLLDGKKSNRVVSPAVPAVELADRHERDHVHSEVAEIVEPLHRIVEGRRLSVLGTRIVERPDLKLVHDDFVGKGRLESLVFPDESIFVINHRRLRTVGHAANLTSPRIFAPKRRACSGGDDVFVGLARSGVGHRCSPDIARSTFDQGIRCGAPIIELTRHGNLEGVRRPNAEGDTGDCRAGFVDRRPEFLAVAGRDQAPDTKGGKQERDAHFAMLVAA